MNTRSNGMLDTVSRVLRYACAALALLCIVFAIIAAISTGCSGGCAGSDSTESGSQSDTSALSPSPVPDSVTLPETADAGQAYQDKLTFLGDSLTAHLVSRGVLTDGQNTKQVWRTKDNMLNLDSPITSDKINLPGTDRYVTIAEAAAELKPEILIITLGTDYGVSYLVETRSSRHTTPSWFAPFRRHRPIRSFCCSPSSRSRRAVRFCPMKRSTAPTVGSRRSPPRTTAGIWTRSRC